ncbi:MAG: HupE/UreJ family protein [Pikeienuella sp.]
MNLRRLAGFLAVWLTPGRAPAHDAFGDLGPFYGGLLHPMVDPVQGLLLFGAALLLARQPAARVRTVYIVMILAGILAVAAHQALPAPELGMRTAGVLMALLGALALSGLSLPILATAALAGGVAIIAGFRGDAPADPRTALLNAAGLSLGLGLFVLFVWCGFDMLQARLGRIAGAVAGSWVTAVGIMVAALPNGVS